MDKSTDSLQSDHTKTNTPAPILSEGLEVSQNNPSHPSSTKSPQDIEMEKRILAKMQKYPERLMKSPLPGHTWNPLKTIPRNSLCPCRSGKKFKACHLNTLPETVPAAVAETYKRTMQIHKTLVFVEKAEKEKADDNAASEYPDTPTFAD